MPGTVFLYVCVCVYIRFLRIRDCIYSHIVVIMCNNYVYKLTLRTPNFIDEESETDLPISWSTSQNFSGSASEVHA